MSNTSLMTSKQMLAKLVSFDTTSSLSNMDMMTYMQDYLGGFGVEARLIPNKDGTKASLFATVGPKDKAGGIGLSGHSDVVPVKGQDWRSDPFILRQQGDKLYGRGTCDMKGFIACVLAAVPEMTKAELKIPLHLIFSYDEEIGCTGVRPTIEMLGKDLPKPQIIFVGEPSEMTVVDAHKGTNSFETEVIGHEAHSSMTHIGVNAIITAGRLITALDDYAAELEKFTDERFEPPFTSLQIGMIEGGTAPNIIPKSCKFRWEFRALPDYDVTLFPAYLEEFAKVRLRPTMKEVSKSCDIITRKLNQVPGLSCPPDSKAVTLALKLAQQNSSHAVSYATEAGLFEQAGCSTIICGPGSIAQAHKPNEFVAISELEKCDAFLARLVDYAQY